MAIDTVGSPEIMREAGPPPQSEKTGGAEVVNSSSNEQDVDQKDITSAGIENGSKIQLLPVMVDTLIITAIEDQPDSSHDVLEELSLPDLPIQEKKYATLEEEEEAEEAEEAEEETVDIDADTDADIAVEEVILDLGIDMGDLAKGVLRKELIVKIIEQHSTQLKEA
ncbi:MAG: hypothetical protein ABIO02_01195, partial [Patescibacteria group bacterium]